jgi:hypothetical protein
MRELPATLLLRSFNFDTLATEVFTLGSLYRYEEATAGVEHRGCESSAGFPPARHHCRRAPEGLCQPPQRGVGQRNS